MRRFRAQDGARSAPSPSHPQSLVIPAKAGTYWRRHARESGNLPHRAANALRPDRSTLSRRVRGVLSPYRERGNSALARLNGAGFPHRRE